MNTVFQSFRQVVLLVCVLFTAGVLTPAVFALTPGNKPDMVYVKNGTQYTVVVYDYIRTYLNGIPQYAANLSPGAAGFSDFIATENPAINGGELSFKEWSGGNWRSPDAFMATYGFTRYKPFPWGSSTMSTTANTCGNKPSGDYIWGFNYGKWGWWNGSTGIVPEGAGTYWYSGLTEGSSVTIVFNSTTQAVFDNCLTVSGSGFPYIVPTYSFTPTLVQSWAQNEPVHTVELKKNGAILQTYTMTVGQTQMSPVSGFHTGDEVSLFDSCSNTVVYSSIFGSSDIVTPAINLPSCAPPPTNLFKLLVVNNTTKTAAVSVFSSVQGSLSLGAIVEPGQENSTNSTLVPGEKIRVTINGVVAWTHTEPTPTLGITKTLYVGDVPTVQTPDPDSADPENPDPINQPPTNRGDHVATTVDSDGTTTHYNQEGDRVIATETDGQTGDVTSRQVWNGVGANNAPTNATASTIADKQARQIDADARRRASEQAKAIAGAGKSGAAGGGDGDAKEGAGDLVAGAIGKAGDPPEMGSYTPPGASSSPTDVWLVTIPGVNQTVDFNPLNSSLFMQFANFTFQAVAWILTYLVVSHALKLFYEFQAGAWSANQTFGADGGATGGIVSIPSALLYAAGIYTFFIIGSTAFSLFATTGIGGTWSGSLDWFSTLGGSNNGSPVMRGVFQLVSVCLPLSHMATCFGNFILLRFYQNGILALVGTVKLFLPR